MPRGLSAPDLEKILEVTRALAAPFDLLAMLTTVTAAARQVLQAERAWREVELPFGFDPVLSLVFSPTDPQLQTLFAGTENQGLWVSTDAGESWSRLAEDTLVDPLNAILASGSDLLADTSAALWYSMDGGASWTDILPEEYAGQEISAILAPKGVGPGSLLLVGFTDGSIQPVRLAV